MSSLCLSMQLLVYSFMKLVLKFHHLFVTFLDYGCHVAQECMNVVNVLWEHHGFHVTQECKMVKMVVNFFCVLLFVPSLVALLFPEHGHKKHQVVHGDCPKMTTKETRTTTKKEDKDDGSVEWEFALDSAADENLAPNGISPARAMERVVLSTCNI